MPRAAHTDLRWAVVFMYWSGHSVRRIARLIHRSRRTVGRWIGLYVTTGAPGPKRRGQFNTGPSRHLAGSVGAALYELLMDEPDLYLDELQAWLQNAHGVTISVPALCQYLLQDLGLTTKKVGGWLRTLTSGCRSWRSGRWSRRRSSWPRTASTSWGTRTRC